MMIRKGKWIKKLKRGNKAELRKDSYKKVRERVDFWLSRLRLEGKEKGGRGR